MDDDVTLKSLGSHLSMADVLDLLGRNTELLEHLTRQLSEASIASFVDWELNGWCHLQGIRKNGVSRSAEW